MARKSSGKSNGKANEARELVIPETSALSEFVRHGAEGVCVSCRKPIRAHYGHRGVWVGCRAPEVPATATFLLVPVILPADRPMTSGVRQGGRPRTIAADHTAQNVGRESRAASKPARVAAVKVDKPASQLQAIQRFVYSPADRRTKVLTGASDAVQDAYKGLLRAKKPVDAAQAAKLAKRPTEANRRCLNWLAEKGLAVKAAVSV